jgi:N-acetylglucosaminyldiphosphoundecaprenol N-acetyl-beta-D-mannosaminyltransferase
MLSQPDGQWIATLNPEIVHYAWHNPALAGALKTASLALADGIGLVWANRLHGGPLRERVTGVDLLEVCLEHCAARSWPVFFLGAVPGVAAEAARRAAQRWPGLPVVGTHHGYFDSADGNRVIRSIQAAAPRLVAVGMGHPRQEIWLAENMSLIAGAVGLACGGSLDILAGKAQRAPEWVQRANIEWLYRVLAAPRVRLRRSSRLFAFGLRMVKLWAWTKSRAGHPGRGADGHGRTT